jgi:hypothetical protein
VPPFTIHRSPLALGHSHFSYLCRMHFEKIHNKGQARLFKNDFLEMLTKTHPLVIWGMYLPVIIYMLFYSNRNLGYPVGTVLLVFFGGMFFWTFFEYIAHRYLFHWVSEHPVAKKISYTLHGNHHHSSLSQGQAKAVHATRSKHYYFLRDLWFVLFISTSVYIHVFPGFYFGIPHVWYYALCHSRVEPAF